MLATKHLMCVLVFVASVLISKKIRSVLFLLIAEEADRKVIADIS